MNILLVLIPVSLFLGGLALALFIWTLRADQYDDPDGAAARVLLNDDDRPAPESHAQHPS
ncbi:MAG: cbb3-type cytochrome oxidase assembly protein CcoS [Tropicimonas sp.]|uniref:cbb3-type cytochrome oxidase assembly protein CcoS n=1 Tax=Tropicimonas sp. TaxID=2067044 RepID=UPI003A89A649